MITRKDYLSIDQKYFAVQSITGYIAVLRSRNTGHFWAIHWQDANGHDSYWVEHKHHKKDLYHRQTGWYPKNFEMALQMIQEHDQFHLKNRQKSRKNHAKESGLL
mgnify:CR=1 FL=1